MADTELLDEVSQPLLLGSENPLFFLGFADLLKLCFPLYSWDCLSPPYEAKVCNFHVLLGVKEEVPWLQVPAQDVPLVAVLQGRDQLPERPWGVSFCHVPWSPKWLHVSPSLRPSIQEQGGLCVNHLQ